MIKRLRARFILLSMGSLLLVLTLILGSVNLVSYRQIVQDADGILDLLAENGGLFPLPEFSRPGGHADKLSPELPYEARYFSVLLGADGAVCSVDTGRIAAVDPQSAARYALEVLAAGRTRGFSGIYRYILQDCDEGTRVIFLDCGRSLSTFQTFLFSSLGISLFGVLAVLLLILLLSGRIIRPVSQSYEKQRRFITDAGHEIKTPLTIIDADAEVLQADIGENEWLEDIRKQTKRLAALTNDLIYLSRMEETQNRLQAIDFPLSDLVEETAQSFQLLARAQGKHFDMHIEPMLSFCGDEAALRQLISILLDNALKYTAEGGHIRLSLERQARTLRLCVFNETATPIPREALAHMFDRFYRADPSRSTQTGGYGIGLSIARAIVAAHKGKLSATSQDGHSLLMCVTLPN